SVHAASTNGVHDPRRRHVPGTPCAARRSLPEDAVTTMVRRAHAYPQAVVTAGDVVDTEVITAPATITVADALRLARRRRARVLGCGAHDHVLTDDLARAESLGLGELPARDVARALPVVAARTPELAVRRHLLEGAAAVIVAGKGAVARAATPRTVAVRARL